MVQLYKIKVVLDTTQSSTEARAEQQRASQTADAYQRATDRKRNAFLDALEKQDKADDKAAQTQKNRAAASAAAFQQMQDRKTKRFLDDLDKQAGAADKAAQRAAGKTAATYFAVEDAKTRKFLAELDRRGAAEDRANQRASSNDQVMQAARNRMIQASNRKRIQAVVDATNADNQGFGESMLAATSFGSAVTGVGAALLGLSAGKELVTSLAASFVNAKSTSEQMAQRVLEIAGGLREIAAIQERVAPDRETLKAHQDIRAASGLTPAMAKDFQTALLNNTGAVGKDKLDDKGRKDLAIQGAMYAARVAVDPGDAKERGALLGILANFTPADANGKINARDVIDVADRVDMTIGRGTQDQKQGVEQYRKLLTSLTSTDKDMAGFLHDPRQAAALSATASIFEPEASATATIEATRALRGFTKWRKTPGTDASQAATLKAMGIDEFDDPVMALQKLFKHADTNFQDEAFDAALARRGFRDQTGNRRLAQFYEQYKTGNLSNIMDFAMAPIVPGEESAKTAAFQKSDVGRDVLGNARIEVAKERAAEPKIPLVLEKKAAEWEVIGAGMDQDTTAGNWQQYLASWAAWTPADKGRDVMIEAQAVKNMRKKLGKDEKSTPGGFASSIIGGLTEPFMRMVDPFGFMPQDQVFAPAVAAGIDYRMTDSVGLAKEIKRLADANDALAKAVRPAAAAAPGPVPAVVPAPAAPRPVPGGWAGRP